MNFIVILIQSIKKFIWDFVEKYIYRLIWREMPLLDCWFFAFINTKYIFFLIYFFLHTFCNFLNMFVFFLSISCTFLFHSFLSTLYFLLLWWVLFFYYILICLLGYSILSFICWYLETLLTWLVLIIFQWKIFMKMIIVSLSSLSFSSFSLFLFDCIGRHSQYSVKN